MGSSRSVRVGVVIHWPGELGRGGPGRRVRERDVDPGTAPGDRHYYRVQGPTLLIEHDNTQGNGTHIHSAWRNPADDFGDDVLAEHYRTHHT